MRLKDYGLNPTKRKVYVQQPSLLLIGVDVSNKAKGSGLHSSHIQYFFNKAKGSGLHSSHIQYFFNLSNFSSKLFVTSYFIITKQRGQVFILHTFNIFSIFLIFLLSFLSLLILSLTRLLAWDTPDSPIPKCVPISFSFSLVYL
jgi:hypothetical protein